ncbi:MAG TPA: homoserine dehydrogenase [Acidimicrobiales bacterium]|nr:homoserine dehydrogenase [Acidimicrobiales bacterium]
MRVGLLGCGTVGSALAELIADDADLLAERTGVRLELARVAVRDLSKQRSSSIDPSIITDDSAALVQDPEIDVVVELIGGIEPAKSLILSALESGKPVVTGNKELLASCWGELFSAASKSGVDLLHEAAVAGAIPLVRSLRESLAGDRITSVIGIVNGTTNYILTRMSEEGISFADALQEAQRLGYAEPDPTADVEGSDAAAKAAILATIAFGRVVTINDVYTEGITRIRSSEISIVRRLGYEVKLLAVAQVAQSGRIGVRVHPAMIPKGHPLAGVRGSFNAVFIEGEAVGEMMLYGRGAGGKPTAAAVLGDLVDAAHNLASGGAGRVAAPPDALLVGMDELRAQYFVSIDVADRPGVLASVAQVFGENQVSIRSMEQLGLGDQAHLVFLTHMAQESAVQATLKGLAGCDPVKRVGALLRVVGQSEDDIMAAQADRTDSIESHLTGSN